jgi:hypothetical protein
VTNGPGGWVRRFDGTPQNLGTEWNAPPTRLLQLEVDRAGTLWALVKARGAKAKHPPFFYTQAAAGSERGRASVQSFTLIKWSLRAYPMLRKNSVQVVDRAKSGRSRSKVPFSAMASLRPCRQRAYDSGESDA